MKFVKSLLISFGLLAAFAIHAQAATAAPYGNATVISQTAALASGQLIATTAGYIDGFVLTNTAPTTGGTVTVSFYDVSYTGSGINVATNKIMDVALQLTVTSSTPLTMWPLNGIHYNNGLVYVDANTSTVNATIITESAR